MTDIEFAKRVAVAMDRIARREVMETDSINFTDMVDKISNYIFYLAAEYLKEKGIKENWIEERIKTDKEWAQKQKAEKTKKFVEENYITDGFGTYWSPICNICGQKTMEIVRPGKCQCSNCG